MTGMASWRAEFYPIEASEVSAEDAAAHSLRKWEGLRPEALAKHRVSVLEHEWTCHEVSDSLHTSDMVVSAATCALCARFYAADDDDVLCQKCPLAIARGGVPCGDEMSGEKHSPWAVWNDRKDPEPMIHWLKLAVEQTRPDSQESRAPAETTLPDGKEQP